jgi:hypothetical protein
MSVVRVSILAGASSRQNVAAFSVVELTTVVPYAARTMDQLARRAGVGKGTARIADNSKASPNSMNRNDDEEIT